jgi:hypothetical protein
VLGFAGTVLLFVAVGAIALRAVDDARHEEKEAAAPTTTAAPDEPPEPAEPDDVDDRGAAIAVHQVTLTFNREVDRALPRRVEREWRANPLLGSIYTLDADQVEDATGFPIAGIASWFIGDDPDEVERFACAYAGQPGVAMVGIDGIPCDSGEPTPFEVVIEIRVGPQVSAAHRETIRHAMEDNGFFDDLTLEGGSGEPGTWTRLRLAGYEPGAAFVCPDAQPFVGDPGVRVRETGPVDACPGF